MVGEIVCPRCGTRNEAGYIFCKSCGEKLDTLYVCPSCSSVIQSADARFCPHCGYSLSPRTDYAPQPQEQRSPISEASIRGIKYIEYYGFISIMSIILQYFILILGININPLGTHSKAGHILFGLSYILLFIDLAALLLLTVFAILAFKNFSSEDGIFTTPYSLSKLAIPGIILVFFGILLLEIGSIASNAGLSLAFLAIGGIFLLISIVLLILGTVGQLLGLWRIGRKYKEVLFKAATILYFIPLLDIITPFLIISAAYSVERRMRDGR